MTYPQMISNLISEYKNQTRSDDIVSPENARLSHYLGIRAERFGIAESKCPFDLTSDVDGILQEQWLEGFNFSEENSWRC